MFRPVQTQCVSLGNSSLRDRSWEFIEVSGTTELEIIEKQTADPRHYEIQMPLLTFPFIAAVLGFFLTFYFLHLQLLIYNYLGSTTALLFIVITKLLFFIFIFLHFYFYDFYCN